jgi:tRNA(adenine34) deaminase
MAGRDARKVTGRLSPHDYVRQQHVDTGTRQRRPNRQRARAILNFFMNENSNDLEFMNAALDEARAAASRGEVPIGAVVVLDGVIISRAGNRTIGDCDPTAHAEVIALREAAHKIGNHRVLGTTLYVTIEPCAMCAGAMIQARVARLVYGGDDAKAGAVRSCFSILEHEKLNHRVDVTSGVLAEQSVELLRAFFELRR